MIPLMASNGRRPSPTTLPPPVAKDSTMDYMGVRRAVVIFPSDVATDAVEHFRSQWDPLAAQIAAHVTLVFPFETNADPEILVSAISDVAHRHTPFAIELADPTVHDDEYLFLLAPPRRRADPPPASRPVRSSSLRPPGRSLHPAHDGRPSSRASRS
jgi:hypothetical protein